jgi:hypothetical protein
VGILVPPDYNVLHHVHLQHCGPHGKPILALHRSHLWMGRHLDPHKDEQLSIHSPVQWWESLM